MKNVQQSRVSKPSIMSPIKMIKTANRPVTCMSVGYNLDKKANSLKVIDDSGSSLHLSSANKQNCCPYDCMHPFVMEDKSFDIPAALFLNLIC